MNELTAETAARELLDKAVTNYHLVVYETSIGHPHSATLVQIEAFRYCYELKKLLTSPPSKPTAIIIWVGLAPATLTKLLGTNGAFARQYEERVKDCGIPFFCGDEILIELIGTELGLGLGARLFASGEGLTRLLHFPTINVGVERVKKDFARAMERLGVPDTKGLLEVFSQTNRTL